MKLRSHSYWRVSRMRDSRRVMIFVILLCLFILSYCWFFAETSFAPGETRPNDPSDTEIVPDVPLGSNSMDSANSTGSSQAPIPYLFQDDPLFEDGQSVSCYYKSKLGRAASCRRVMIDVRRELSEQYMLRFNATSEILLRESYRTQRRAFVVQYMKMMPNPEPNDRKDPDALVLLVVSAQGWMLKIDGHEGVWLLDLCRDGEPFGGDVPGCHIWSFTPYQNMKEEPYLQRRHRTSAPGETRPNDPSDTKIVPDVPLRSITSGAAISSGSSQPLIPYLFEDDPSFVDGQSVSCKDALEFGRAASCRRVIIHYGRKLSKLYVLRFNATSQDLLKESYRTQQRSFVVQRMQVMNNTEPNNPDGFIPLRISGQGWMFRIDRHKGVWILDLCRDDEPFEGDIRDCHIWYFTPYRNLAVRKPKRGHR